MLCQFDAVHFRHDDIRQQQIEPVGIDIGHGLRAGRDGDDLISRSFQSTGKIDAHALIIFGQ